MFAGYEYDKIKKAGIIKFTRVNIRFSRVKPKILISEKRYRKIPLGFQHFYVNVRALLVE